MKLVFTCKCWVCDKHLSFGCIRQLFGSIYLRIRTIIWIVRNKNKKSRKTGKKKHFRVRYCIQYFFIRGRKIVCTRAWFHFCIIYNAFILTFFQITNTRLKIKFEKYVEILNIENVCWPCYKILSWILCKPFNMFYCFI